MQSLTTECQHKHLLFLIFQVKFTPLEKVVMELLIVGCFSTTMCSHFLYNKQQKEKKTETTNVCNSWGFTTDC